MSHNECEIRGVFGHVYESLAWDPGIVGRILRLVTTKFNMWNEIDLLLSDLCEPESVRSDCSM
jgi:hypothetical protein